MLSSLGFLTLISIWLMPFRRVARDSDKDTKHEWRQLFNLPFRNLSSSERIKPFRPVGLHSAHQFATRSLKLFSSILHSLKGNGWSPRFLKSIEHQRLMIRSRPREHHNMEAGESLYLLRWNKKSMRERQELSWPLDQVNSPPDTGRSTNEWLAIQSENCRIMMKIEKRPFFLEEV